MNKAISIVIRGRSRAAVTSKMERFVIIVNGFQPLTMITKRSILDVAAVLDPPLITRNQLVLNYIIISDQLVSNQNLYDYVIIINQINR